MTIHLPAVVADYFGISRSQARRAIVAGGVKLNGWTVTDLDVDLDTIPGDDDVRIELGRVEPRDSILRILEAEREMIQRD